MEGNGNNVLMHYCRIEENYYHGNVLVDSHAYTRKIEMTNYGIYKNEDFQMTPISTIQMSNKKTIMIESELTKPIMNR